MSKLLPCAVQCVDLVGTWSLCSSPVLFGQGLSLWTTDGQTSNRLGTIAATGVTPSQSLMPNGNYIIFLCHKGTIALPVTFQSSSLDDRLSHTAPRHLSHCPNASIVSHCGVSYQPSRAGAFRSRCYIFLTIHTSTLPVHHYQVL